MAAKALVAAVGSTTAVGLAEGLGFSDVIPGMAGEVKNTGSVVVYIGGSDVNKTNKGYPIAVGDKFTFRAGAQDEIYMLAASGTGEVTAMLVGA